MTDQEILDNDPKGATHIDNDGEYAKEDGYGLEYFRLAWHKYTEPVELRSLADIKRIAELEKKLSYAETMSDKEQVIRDLEQQTKGVEDFLMVVVKNLPKEIIGAFKSYTEGYIEALKEQVK